VSSGRNAALAAKQDLEPLPDAVRGGTVPLSADTARVRELLAGLVLVAPGRLGDRPDPGVAVAELTADSAVFSLGVWVADPQTAAQTAAWLREQTLARLADDGMFRGVEASVAK